MKSLSQLCYAAAGILSLSASVTGSATTVYEASYSGSGLPYYAPHTAYGDEIVLAGTARALTGFHFAYYSDYALKDGLSFTLYSNDGPLWSGFPSPGTVLFSSSYDIMVGTSGVDIDLAFTADPANPLPDRLTFVAEFLGGGTAGLLLADSPTIGASGNDFWQWTAGSWGLRQLIGYTSNFEATVTAEPVPEAAPRAAAVLALASLTVIARHRRAHRN